MTIRSVEAAAEAAVGGVAGCSPVAPDPDQWRYDLAAERVADLRAGRSASRPMEDVVRDFVWCGSRTPSVVGCGSGTPSVVGCGSGTPSDGAAD
jgi:hypothetical protein